MHKTEEREHKDTSEVRTSFTLTNAIDEAMARRSQIAQSANRRLMPNPAHPDQPVIKVKRKGASSGR